ncbi:MAG TPA: STAS domain-containing protein [Pseudonocardiaceae bacterium]|nr:STAS domain-containing protein [Pseudonocardiaceae bacterium]
MTATKPQIPTDRCRLTLSGEIDLANAEDYLAAARAMIAEWNTAPCFTIDLSGVTFMGTSGLTMLVEIRKAATNAEMELRLAGSPWCVSRLLEITALADHFGVTAGPPQAELIRVRHGHSRPKPG